MNSINKIKNFLDTNNNQKLIVNCVSDAIGTFYENVILHICKSNNVKIIKFSSIDMSNTNSLFEEKKIQLYYLNNKKFIEKVLEKDEKIIIILDYKNFKYFKKTILSINGYNYQEDIKYYLSNELKIDNQDLIEYCLTNPELVFSEISKFLLNSKGYLKETKINEKNNFILDIRKDLYNLKKNNDDMKSIYENLKREVKYKKFSFLTF